MSEVRPVWITREQRSSLVFAVQEMPPFGERGDILDILDAWNSAPANPTKVTTDVLRESVGNKPNDAQAVLQALGMPT